MHYLDTTGSVEVILCHCNLVWCYHGNWQWGTGTVDCDWLH